MKHVAFFGDSEYRFTLSGPQIEELERIAGAGFGEVYRQTILHVAPVATVLAVIRLALIGGGVSPKRAAELVATYGETAPLVETYELAADVVETRWTGKSPADEIKADSITSAEITAHKAAEKLRTDIATAYADDEVAA